MASTPSSAPGGSSCSTTRRARGVGRRLADRLLRAGAARDRHRPRPVPRRRRVVVAGRRARRRAARSSTRASGTATKTLSTGFGELAAAGRRRADRAARVVDAARARIGAARRRLGGAGLHARRAAARLGRDRRARLTQGRRVADYRVIDGCRGTRRRRRRRSQPGPARSRSTPSAQRVPLLAARLPHPDVPARRRHVPLRSAGDRRLRDAAGGHRRRGVGAARGEPGPACPARGRARPRDASSTPSSPPGCSATPRVGLGAVVEDTARHHPREGALGGRLVDPAAAPVLARVRRARRRAARRRARRARRGARRAGQDRVSPPRSSARCSTATPKPPRRRAVASARAACTRVRGSQGARGRPRAVARPRRLRPELDTAPGRLVPDRALVAAAASPTRRPSRSSPQLQGVHRAREPHVSSIAGGRRSRRGRATDRSAARAGTRRRLPPAAPRVGGPQPRGRRPPARRPARSSRRWPRSWTCRSRTCSPPISCVAWPGRPPEPLSAAAIGDALAELGARPWQIDATAQMIADAFVEACKARHDAPETAS